MRTVSPEEAEVRAEAIVVWVPNAGLDETINLLHP
jgi:hypothetical protein